MDHEYYADRTPLPPAVIPLVDFENKLLPVQFVVEPPDDLKWNKDEYDENTIDLLNVNDRNKIELLDKYLDLVYIDKRTKEIKTSAEFKKKQNHDKLRNEEQQQAKKEEIKLANEINSPNLSPTANKSTKSNSTIADKSFTKEKKKSFNFVSLSSLTIKFSNLKRSVSKRLKRNLTSMNTNINNLARRSSFRLSRRRSSKLNKYESQAKSTNNLDTTAISTNSLNLSTNKSSPDKLDKSPNKSSNKSLAKSPSKLSNKSPTKSIKSTNSSANIEAKKKEEECIPNEFILAAEMHCDNLPSYRDEFIRNYLTTARLRFLNECDLKSSTEKSVQKINSEYSSHKGSTVSSNASLNSTSSNFKEDDYAQCVNNGCLNFGKSSTNYLCDECFITQKKELIEIKNSESIKTES